MSDTPNYKDLVAVHANSLWGISGGQLEYVSQRTEWRHDADSRHYPVMVIRFTDHDVQATKDFIDNENLVEKQYYEFEFPLFSD
jgi:hypothetical protein